MNNFSKEDIFKGIVVFLLLVIIFKLFAHKEGFKSNWKNLSVDEPCTFNTDCLSRDCNRDKGVCK
jgi:hypothetical protein